MSWFNYQIFWSLFYDWMFSEESFQQAKMQSDDLVHLSGVQKGAILDLCCGPGRYSVPLGVKGFKVTGVDLQPMLLEKAQTYAEQENTTVEYIEENMLTFKRANAFDLAISMFSSFGYFSDPADDLQVLENVYTSLKPGGKILMDLRGKEIHAMAKMTDFSHEMPNGDLIFHRTKVNSDWTKSYSDWVYIKGEKASRFKMELNLYSGAEIRMLLHQVGFGDVKLYGDLEGNAYNLDAKRLIVVAVKNSES